MGDFCKSCDCSGNANPYASRWCDHRTGECLQCLGNTAGWKCDKCLDGFWGNPFSGKCKGKTCGQSELQQIFGKMGLFDFYLACDCNAFGSLSSSCDPSTGQCLCKLKYVGRTCSACEDGFGNTRAGCRRCGCHQVGARSDNCDADSGQCECRDGVGGLTCGECRKEHYGFSDTGCKSENGHF